MRAAVRSAILAFAALAAGLPARSATINASLSGFDAGEQVVVNHVIRFWEQTILDAFTVNVSIAMLDLSGDHLGQSFGLVAGSDGRPSEGTIQIDDRSSSLFPWFVDPTPAMNEEYLPGFNEFHFKGVRPGPAGENYDLLTVLHHEMAHVLGFSIQYLLFEEHVEPSAIDPLRNYSGSSASAVLAPAYEGTHLSDFYHPSDLLISFQSRGERMVPSALDLAILSDAYGYRLADPAPNPVPEPRTISVIVPLLMGAVWRFLSAARKKHLIQTVDS